MTIEELEPTKKVNIVLDASMLDMLQLCFARFNYRYNLNKEVPSRIRFDKDGKPKAHPLDRGTIIHNGLEAYYKAIQVGTHFDDAMQLGLNKAKLSIAENEGLISEVDARLFIRTLEEHCEYWRVEDQRYEILEVEKPFMYTLYEDDEVRILMIGKMDVVLRDNSYPALPMDHKTHDREFPVRRLSNQFMNYTNGVGQPFLLVNRIGLQATYKPADKFKRVPLSYDPLILDEWKKNTVQWMFRYLECAATNEWPMNFTSCDKYFRQCEYLPICESSGLEAKVYKLNTDFKTVEPWDVTKTLGDSNE